jgi:hypothetical protein
MSGEAHDGVVAFRPIALGREAVMLGRVQVGEIMPTDGGRHQACFRLTLPDASHRQHGGRGRYRRCPPAGADQDQ